MSGVVTINEQSGGIDVVITGLINGVLPVIAALAVGAIIYSGALYILSQGEPEKLATAKRSLLWSIVGLVVIVLSYAIVLALSKVVGTQIIGK